MAERRAASRVTGGGGGAAGATALGAGAARPTPLPEAREAFFLSFAGASPLPPREAEASSSKS